MACVKRACCKFRSQGTARFGVMVPLISVVGFFISLRWYRSVPKRTLSFFINGDFACMVPLIYHSLTARFGAVVPRVALSIKAKQNTMKNTRGKASPRGQTAPVETVSDDSLT